MIKVQNLLKIISKSLSYSLLILLLLFPGGAQAQTQDDPCTEQLLRNLGVAVVTCEGNNLQCGPSTTSSRFSSVYVLGDSLIAGAETLVQTALVETGLTITKINADGGRAITSDTYGNEPNGLEAVTADKDLIAQSDAIVIELGTNSRNEDLNVEIPKLVNLVRGFNPDIRIFWVNLFYGQPSRDDRNAIIQSNSQALDYEIIDTVNANIELGPDATHPTASGSATFAQTIANAVQASNTVVSGGAPSGAGGEFEPFEIVGGISTDGNPTHILSWLNGIDEVAAANAINAYIQERNPESPFVGLGSAFVAGAKKYNVNPFLPVGHLKIENGFVNNPTGNGWHSPASVYRTAQAARDRDSSQLSYSNNAFGRSAPGTSQPKVYYKQDNGTIREVFQWSTWQASLDGNNGTEDPWFALINRRYLSQDGNPTFAIASGDFATYLSHYAPNSDGNDEQEYINGLFETIDELVLMTGSGTGFASDSSGCNTSAQNGVSVDGFFFPLAPQTRAVSGVTVGQTETVHHDETAAFDLFSYDSAEVYSIRAGTPVKVERNFRGVEGCGSIQLLGDDGLFYWYGHLKEISIEEGVPILGGVQIAKIADESYGEACLDSGPHLHIDRGCTIVENGLPTPQWGGGDGCRDPLFIEVLSRVYEALP